MEQEEFKPRDWVNYRSLKKGEIIEKDDEVLHDGRGWRKTNTDCVGGSAPDPQFTAHRMYRRKLETNL